MIIAKKSQNQNTGVKQVHVRRVKLNDRNARCEEKYNMNKLKCNQKSEE